MKYSLKRIRQRELLYKLFFNFFYNNKLQETFFFDLKNPDIVKKLYILDLQNDLKIFNHIVKEIINITIETIKIKI